MLDGVRISFVGAGAMAEAMIKGLLDRRLVTADHITAAGPRLERGVELRERYRVAVTTDNTASVAGAGIVVLSVKPQMLGRVMPALKGGIAGDALVLSIVAGARMAVIEHGLAHPAVVRSMPNTPAQIGLGITVWTASDAVTPAQREQARAVLTALGEEVFVDDEDYLDMATALSGTGPSYVFLFMEALVDAGVHLGFPRYLAERLVLETVRGSAEYARHAGKHLASLRNQVTSPGGTSAEALYYLEKAGFRTALSRAVWAAYQRSVQLGRGRKRSPMEEEKQ
ncbi:MAG: pyrroline-5-carboxylate reductase [Thermoanaerobaculales bacterium]